MPTIIRLIKLWAMGRALSARTPLFHGLITRLAAIFILSVIIAVLVAASIAGGLYFTYGELLLHGFGHYTSLGIVALATAFLLLCLIIAAWICWRKFKRLMRHVTTDYAPISMRVSRVAHSFIDGLMGTETDRDY